uniref:Uncharacterized protein n=1 Tax=viral metagenome TaxID=1070528 RepID=A0A6C0HSK1_9ZZZZ
MLTSTRFTDKTYREREAFMRRNNIECIYGSPMRINKTLLINQLLFVVEMNNDTNQIMGIGLIRNIICDHQDIYEDPNYNRYIYLGKYRLVRQEIEDYDKKIVEVLELILFKGRGNAKRLSGITLMNKTEIIVTLTEQIRVMFKTIYGK